jgi:hypothetical protein
MFSLTERTPLETEVEETDTRFGFTWVCVDGKYRIRSPDDQFKEVPKVVVDTLRQQASETPIRELIDETSEQDAEAADVLREMYEGDFIREGAPVERVVSPDDIRLWHRVLAVAILLGVNGVLWVTTLSRLAPPFLDRPFGYLLDAVPLLIPLIPLSVVVHELGHYYTARKQGLDPSFGASVINGVVPAVVTKTHGGWSLPRNRRMWNTLAGPAYGLVWTLVVFGVYYALFPHPGVAVAGILCFNLQFMALNPLFHGDGYLLLTDFLDEQNVRTRGIRHLKQRRPTWLAAYAAASYGFVVVGLLVDLVLGYLVGKWAGSAVVLAASGAIYADSRYDVLDRLRATVSPFGG